jgi:hypothetical protein
VRTPVTLRWLLIEHQGGKPEIILIDVGAASSPRKAPGQLEQQQALGRCVRFSLKVTELSCVNKMARCAKRQHTATHQRASIVRYPALNAVCERLVDNTAVRRDRQVIAQP